MVKRAVFFYIIVLNIQKRAIFSIIFYSKFIFCASTTTKMQNTDLTKVIKITSKNLINPYIITSSAETLLSQRLRTKNNIKNIL